MPCKAAKTLRPNFVLICKKGFDMTRIEIIAELKKIEDWKLCAAHILMRQGRLGAPELQKEFDAAHFPTCPPETQIAPVV